MISVLETGEEAEREQQIELAGSIAASILWSMQTDKVPLPVVLTALAGALTAAMEIAGLPFEEVRQAVIRACGEQRTLN